MKKRSSRKDKEISYNEKYSHIPIDYRERLSWLCDSLNISKTSVDSILTKRDLMIDTFYYHTLEIILFEVPEGSPRPRFRIINRSNLGNMAISNPNFVHVYSLTGQEDYTYMRRLINEDLLHLDQLIITPCDIDISAFVQTPNYYSKEDKILAEIGLERPLSKPDWDNIEKKYSDMFNKNVWLDDTLVVKGTINKFYSALPRIEIRLKYMNMVYNKYQYNQISKKLKEENYSLDYFSIKERKENEN